MVTTTTKEALLKEVTEEELSAFMAVQNRGGRKPSCQENPESYKTARRMTHTVQSEAFLQSYLNDLLKAKSEGRNLVFEKYALMEGSLPRTNFDEHIDAIVSLESKLHDEVHKKFPNRLAAQNRNTNGNGFQNYLSAELQTFSPQSLKLYYDNLVESEKEGRNIVQERYSAFMQALGMPPLE